MIVGDSDYRLRLLSGIASALSIPAMYFVIRQRFSATNALIAATFMACAWSQIEWAQQARPYAMLILISLLAIAAMQAIERKPNCLNAAWLALAVCALCLTHYFAAGAVLALLVYGLIVSRRAWCAALAGILLACIIWGPIAVHTVPHYSAEYPGYGATPAIRIGPDLLIAPTVTLFHNPTLACCVPVALLLLIAMRNRQAMLLSLWLCFSLGAIAIGDLIRHTDLLHSERYVMIATPAVAGLIATIQLPKLAYTIAAAGILLGIASDGFNRATALSDCTQYVWYASHPPKTQGDVLVFAGAPDYPGCQPLDYIDYRRHHRTFNGTIMFTTSNERLSAALPSLGPSDQPR
jgi:4-amino-4-deoxy-L-arabinose transferase-like glycosyltransferase